jgi:hypothetical protein
LCEKPITDEELKTAKDSLIQGLPQAFRVRFVNQQRDHFARHAGFA